MKFNKYRELEYSEYVYKNGFVGDLSNKSELRLVAIYMKRILDLKPKAIREGLMKFCRKYYKGFKFERDYTIVDYAINQANKKENHLIQISSIPIFKSQIEYIKDLRIDNEKLEEDCKKIIFTILVQIRLMEESYRQKRVDCENSKDINFLFYKGSTRKYSELKKQSYIRQNLKIGELMHILYKNRLIKPLYKGTAKLEFMDILNQLEDGEVLFEIDNFDDIGLYYDYHTDGKFVKKCEVCGRLIYSRNRKNLKYCEDCAYEKKLESKRVGSKNEPIGAFLEF